MNFFESLRNFFKNFNKKESTSITVKPKEKPKEEKEEMPIKKIIVDPPAPLIFPYTSSLNYLEPKMAVNIPFFIEEIKNISLDIKITCTARLYRTQVALYAQGRQPLAEINRLRKLAGLGDIGATEGKKIVTWTLMSKHLVNYDDTDPNNDYSQAFDFVLLTNKKANWNIKANVNKNLIPDYKEIGDIAVKQFGWVWGGNWKTPDYPHIQLA